MPPLLRDFHCHLDLYQDGAGVARRAAAVKVEIVAVTTTPRAYRGNVDRFGAQAEIGLGLHPELAASKHADIELFATLLPLTVIVGEIGLDGRPQHRGTWAKQAETFDSILRLVGNECRDIVMSVHSPRAAAGVLDALERAKISRVRTVLHWFTGSSSEADRATRLGCYFSVNSAMLSNERGVALVSRIPRERLLLETDGPFTTIRDREAEPADLWGVTSQLADALKADEEELVRSITANDDAFLSGLCTRT